MANGLKLKIDGSAVAAVALRSAGTRAMIAQKTEAVAAAARGTAEDPESVHHAVAGVSRARGYVSVPTHEETAGAVLSRALGAAR